MFRLGDPKAAAHVAVDLQCLINTKKHKNNKFMSTLATRPYITNNGNCT